MIRTLVVLLTAILAISVPLQAQSLWTQSSESLFADPKARQVGDLLTIEIVEVATSVQSASTDYDKNFEHNNAAGVGPLLKLIPDLSYSADQAGSTSGQTTLTNTLRARITATVTNVLPNGVMEISAVKTTVTNGEKQDITLTGKVRSEDVGRNNTVLSTYLADVSITYTGKGAIGDRQKEGIISKLLKFLF